MMGDSVAARDKTKKCKEQIRRKQGKEDGIQVLDYLARNNG